mmetsp:Transcript_22482/g.52875  ORF Transcript_22482/g.52875 Transcript_22482/m.52875 type:complete len:745 (-) Transcript_22482:15-2249(-)
MASASGFRPDHARPWESVGMQKGDEQPEARSALKGTPPAALDALQQEEMSMKDLRRILKGALDIKEMGNEAFAKGEYYRALDFYDQAFKRLQTLGETEEDKQSGLRASIHYNRARAYYKIEDYRRSAEEARACLRCDPEHAKAKRILEELAPNIVGAADQLAQPKPAQTREEDVAKPSANRLVKGLLQLKDEGNTALLRGNASEAIATYSKAILRFAEVEHELVGANQSALKATLFANRSQAHINLKNWEEALEDARSSLAVQPDNPKALHRKQLAENGLASLQQQRDHGEALKNALFYKNQGNRRLSEGDGKAAADEYTSGLEWLEDLPRGDQNVREIRIALLSNRAQAHLKRKLWQDALNDAEAVLREDARHPKAKFRKAKALVELARYSEAASELRQIAEAEPGNEDVKEMLAKVEALRAEAPTQALATRQEDAQGARRAAFREGDSVEVVEEFKADCGSNRFQGMAPGRRGTVISLERDFATVDFGDCLRKVGERDFEKLIKVKKDRQHTMETEAKRLQRESEADYDAERHRDALQKVMAVVALLQEMVELAVMPKEPPSKVELMWRPKEEKVSSGAKETKQLLIAYTQKVRCELALRDFLAAQETADRAVKLHRWEEERLEHDFDLPRGLRGAAPLMELLSSVGDAVRSMQAMSSCLGNGRANEAWDHATKATRLLEKKDWPATMPLRAELFALRAEATLQRSGGSPADSEADAERALALDAGCARAQAALRAAALRTD